MKMDKSTKPDAIYVDDLYDDNVALRAENERLRAALEEVVTFVETFCEECEEPKIRVNVLTRAYAVLDRDKCAEAVRRSPLF
jgi:cell division septum initiation protein DivIVA